MVENEKVIYQLLGISFFAKILTHISGGLIGICGMVKSNIPIFMENVVENIDGIYSGILLQIVSCVAIMFLGVILYHLTTNVSRRISTFALCLYVFGAILLAMSQIIAFVLLKNSQLYVATGDAGLADTSRVLLNSMDFTMNMANIPICLGAVFYYGMLFKNKAIPSWLSLLGLVTVAPVFIGSLIQVYGVIVPFGIMVLHAPFEFIAGAYIFFRGSSKIGKNINYMKRGER